MLNALFEVGEAELKTSWPCLFLVLVMFVLNPYEDQ